MILSDWDLKNYIKSGRLVIQPFNNSTIRENGVDLTLDDEYVILKKTTVTLSMSSDISSYYYRQKAKDEIITIDVLRHVLLQTKEYLKMPNNLMGFVNLRSTFARFGLIIPPTIIDAGFCGRLTIEVLGSSFPIRIPVGTRFLHVVFSKLLNPVETVYKGKYQNQKNIEIPYGEWWK